MLGTSVGETERKELDMEKDQNKKTDKVSIDMLSSFLKQYQNKIHKVILISAGAVDKDQMPLPYYDYSLFDGQILNILGDKDHNSVKNFTEYILSLNIKNFQNIIISDADHFYKGKISSLAMQVNKWLKLD